MERSAVLLTGRPGIGKTTAIMRALDPLDLPACGFYTREVRDGRGRIGFEIITLSGEIALLATKLPEKRFAREARLGMYRINVGAVDEVAVPALQKAAASGKLVVVDEIGPMELFSPIFRSVVLQILDSDVPLLGAVMQRSHPFSDVVKRHERVHLIIVTHQNRDEVPAQVAALFVEAGNPGALG